jgi:hypothetical protein
LNQSSASSLHVCMYVCMYVCIKPFLLNKEAFRLSPLIRCRVTVRAYAHVPPKKIHDSPLSLFNLSIYAIRSFDREVTCAGSRK